MKKQRKNYTADGKVAILREHLLEKILISGLCEKHGMHPTMFYRWQKDFFENGITAEKMKDRVCSSRSACDSSSSWNGRPTITCGAVTG